MMIERRRITWRVIIIRDNHVLHEKKKQCKFESEYKNDANELIRDFRFRHVFLFCDVVLVVEGLEHGVSDLHEYADLFAEVG